MRTALMYFCLMVHLPHASIAASFDCAKAASVREKVICSDRALSQAASKLDGLYAAALHRLSDQGSHQLRDDERQWLNYLSDACPLSLDPDDESKAQTIACLTRAYSDRVRDFEQIAVRHGPFLFTRIDRYSVTHLKTKADEYDTGLAIHEVSYPRIDSPSNSTTIEWNRNEIQGDKGGGCDSGDGDTSNDYQLGLVTARLISVTKTNWTYCHGTSHGFGGSTVETLVLFPSPHALKPSDLFRNGVRWKERLNDFALDWLRKASVAGHYTLENLDTSAVRNIVSDPAHWNLRQDGIALISNPYELGLGYATHLDIVVPWFKIRNLMVQTPSVP